MSDKKTAKEKIIVPEQKMFRFDSSTTTESIDGEINEWLLNRAKDKLPPPQLGKLQAHANYIYIVYYFARHVEI